MKMNEMIIHNVSLLFNVEKSLKKFANILITLLINFFFDYDQIMLVEKYQNLITSMISLKLLKMIQLSHKIINSIIQFVKIIIEIF